jgi:hypothetical protein
MHIGSGELVLINFLIVSLILVDAIIRIGSLK